MFNRRRTVTVIYKSGAKVRLRVKEMTVTRRATGGREVSWDSPNHNPLLFGIDDVAAIFQGRV